ncbi:hypothetical protein [Pelosinus sp. IPA-1]|uniref:hypothetical protein n=1 Tax=Pelosinus sp. IPA-1 TaxID=3029569 RepID=UPI0024361C96|nr:hypothetical protein [Pelosinus sp. IPA-1]GMA98226.1 hypothetical protein PIPA1_10260 [Pelosinus sp. IPA-1]
MNRKKFLKTIASIVIVLVLCVFGLLFLIIRDNYREARGTDTQNINYGEYTKYVDIYDVVKEAYVTDNGYTKFSKHMTEDVFKYINHTSYKEKANKRAQPLKINFELREIYQTKDKENNLIYVDMIYSLVIADANGEIITGAGNAHITFTVRVDENGWYILNKYEKP